MLTSEICSDLKRTHTEWRQSSIRDFDTQLNIELRKIDHLEREAFYGVGTAMTMGDQPTDFAIYFQ